MELLQRNNVTIIVSLTRMQYPEWSSSTREAGVPKHRHKWVACADSSDQDILALLDDICDFMEQMQSSALFKISHLSTQENHAPNAGLSGVAPEAILVHCSKGVSRSPTAIAAYLTRKFALPLEDELNFLRTKRNIKPSANFTRQLEIWEEINYKL